MDKKQTDYDAIIGRSGEEWYVLNYIFTDSAVIGSGAVGSIFEPVTVDEAQARRDAFDENGKLWRMAVEAGDTDSGHDEWREMVLDNDGDDAVFDLSYPVIASAICDMLNKRNPEANIELCECVGGGRCFPIGMKWGELLRPDLWALIQDAERKTSKNLRD